MIMRGPLFFGLMTISGVLLADLLVFPTRVELNDKRRASYVALRHRGGKPETYSVSAVFYRMLPNGGMTLISEPSPEDRAALKFIKFSPRKVTLAPNAEQVVRIMVAGGATLPDGDYRLHLHFEPSSDPDSQISPQNENAQIVMQLKAKIAVAVPVIYRHGQTTSKVSLSELSIYKDKENKVYFKANLENIGNAFPFGDLSLTWKPTPAAEALVVGTYVGVSSYVPKREVSFQINDQTVDYSKGTLKLEFKDPVDSGAALLSSVELNLTTSLLDVAKQVETAKINAESKSPAVAKSVSPVLDGPKRIGTEKIATDLNTPPAAKSVATTQEPAKEPSKIEAPTPAQAQAPAQRAQSDKNPAPVLGGLVSLPPVQQ